VIAALVYVVWTSSEVTYAEAGLAPAGSVLVFFAMLAAIVGVGIGILGYKSINLTRFVTLVSGVGAILALIGFSFEALFNLGARTSVYMMFAIVTSYYLITTCALHARLAYLLARQPRR